MRPDPSADLARPLPRMISITWQKGPDLPQGFQDSCGGVVGRTLITCCGFCQGAQHWTGQHQRCTGKEHKYPRGFLSNTWGLDLRTMHPWQSLPPFPGTARQGTCSAVVGEQLYTWGGFNYCAPYCYRDGYRLVAIRDPVPAARDLFRDQTGLELREFDTPERLFAQIHVDTVALTGPNDTHSERCR